MTAQHSGAGPSDSWNALEGPEPGTHWFNLRDEWIATPDDKYFTLPWWWRVAIHHPEERIDVTFGRDGKDGSAFAMYYPERKQMLAGTYDCPRRWGHHLYETCGVCGQYG